MHVRRAFISLFCFYVSAGFTINALAETTAHRSKSENTAVSPKRLAKLFEQHTASLQQWMEQVYSSNPSELQKSTQVSPREMAEWVFHGPFNWKFDAIRSLQGSDALQLSVSDEFPGDRILAFTTGTYTLLSPYFLFTQQHNSAEYKPIAATIQEIKRTVDALMQMTRNSAASITISATECQALLTLLSQVESGIHTDQP
jgi:SUMO ligase MMS21 Smc5/6 complex component